jgi:hypothetical protein
MLEKDIENLIASYPSDFFPNENLKLFGQQVNLGGRYADVIFKDRHERTIIVEVKRGILTREASGQIAEYYGLLKQKKPTEIIELVLCANIIPPERKVFLETIGIECKELGIALILNIANKYNYKFLDTVQDKVEPIEPQQSLNISEDNNVWIFQAKPGIYDILNALSNPKLDIQRWQVNQNRNRIKKGDVALIWMSGKEGGIYAVGEVVTNPAFMPDSPESDKYWISEKHRADSRLRVDIRITKKLVNNPIFRDYLKGIAELQNLSILKYAQATNFPVSKEEWEIIKRTIDNYSLIP